MGDRYVDLVNSGATRTLAKALGLPRPAVLRRTDPASVDVPLAVGPVVVLGGGSHRGDDDGARPAVEALVATLASWGVEALRAAPPATTLGAVVLVLTDIDDPEDLTAPALALAGALQGLAPGGRVVTISRPVSPGNTPRLAAARQAVDAFARSVAKELRFGATGNGILLADGVEVDAPSTLGALRFFLSARSAFVSGQLLTVGTGAGVTPAAWARPLEGRVAVVTGAARGIGAAIARVLARDGARVVGVDVPAAGEALAALANEVGGMAVQLDVSAGDAGARLIDHVLPRFGRLDAVVHNAGITRDRLLVHMTRPMWDPVLAVNLVAQLRINEALLAAGALGPGSRLVSLASTSGISGNRGQTNYAATKGGVIGMTRALAPVLAERGGTANAVAPGFIETEMTARMPVVARETARRLNTLRQGGLPVDVAEAIAFLVSPQAGGINGQLLRVCGQNLIGA